MGACASAPPRGAGRGPPGGLTGTSPTSNDFASELPVSRRHMRTSQEGGKCSTADAITTAFVAQATIEPQLAKGLAANLAGRRASAQATHLGIAPTPTAESLTDLQAFHSGVTKAALSVQPTQKAETDWPLDTAPAEESFEAARAETARRLDLLQKTGRDRAGTAWAAADDKPVSTDHGRDNRVSDLGLNSPRWKTSGSGAAPAEPEAVVAASRSITAEQVVPVGDDVGEGLEGSVGAAGGATWQVTGDVDELCGSSECVAVAAAAAAGMAARDARQEAGPVPAPKTTTGPASPNPFAQPQTQPHTDADPEIVPEPESDLGTSLPLPNLVSTAGGPQQQQQQQEAASGDGRVSKGYRLSEKSYDPRTRLGLDVQWGGGSGSLEGRPRGNVTRNSDLGYYLEEARFGSGPAHPSPAFRGAQPVRHNLLDSPMARQLVLQQAAREAEAGGSKAPLVLDYVPPLKSQLSRGKNLLSQPSQKRKLLGGEPQAGDGDLQDGDGGSRGPPSSRLDYQPVKSFCRRQITAAPGSTAPATLLLPTSPPSGSRRSLVSQASPTTPTNTAASAGGPGAASGRGIAADSGRCFYATSAVIASPVCMPYTPSQPGTERHRGGLTGGSSSGSSDDPRVAGNTSGAGGGGAAVRFGPVETRSALPSPVRSSQWVDLSPRMQRQRLVEAAAATLEQQRPSAPQLRSTPSRLRFQQPQPQGSQEGAAAAVGDGSGWVPGTDSRVPAPGLSGGVAWSERAVTLQPRASAPAIVSDAAASASAGGSEPSSLREGEAGASAAGSGSGSRMALRAARLLASLHRLGAGSSVSASGELQQTPAPQSPRLQPPAKLQG